MVPETLFIIPVTVGAVIVGPMIIGAAILALIGLGAVYLSGGSKKPKRITPGAGPGGQISAGKRDPLDDKSTEELRYEAGEMLVAADNAVQASEQELLFASASYGDQKVATFQQDLNSAKEHLRESFRMQQQVDTGQDADESRARDLYKQIIRQCEKVNETLQSHKEQFDGLRDLERDPRPALQELAGQLSDLTSRRQRAETALTSLAERYDDDALQQYRDNLTQSAQTLQAAEDSRSQAETAVESGQSADAVLALHSGEQAAADTKALVESMEETSERLESARKNLDIGIAQTEQDLAQAKATHAAGQAPELAGPIAAAETAVRRAKEALASAGRIDPLELLQSLELAHRELDTPLNSVRDRQARDRRAREMLNHELLTARNQVQSSLDFLRSRRYGISSTARTRMAEAERCLTEAQTIGDSQPSKAVDLAQQAKTLAIQAAQIAEREAATANMQSMGGGFGSGGYGTGGGFGGFGYGYHRRSYGGFGSGGFRPRRRRGFF
ncbi:hypothetical protein HGQ17_12865 [Nesterenkonia sp. MY13]|uniref:TPM domain-containing protein n=1 Tax=Nesterenkonia sedimenti TaxID=1463632 RepID=A0A7X8YEI6_9MICC|nr:hypothetical protein [Nesterenkonia sedimenti]NLS10868.1 hypothetical protein [Nesterenkonia sedimenti]